ncbi:MAG: glycosyltransferase family 39 protein [Candidatus Bathyarchaeota archaeon]
MILVIFSVALFSRLYNLNDFPNFSIPDYPWVGTATGELKGLYHDERVYSNLATILITNPSHLTIYQPWLQLLAIGASISIFSLSPFSVRLPSAIFSSVSIVLVYLICMHKFKNKLAACISSLYLVVMVPALIYNRMAFLENGAALFFLASYFCLIKYSEQKREKYIILSTIFAGLSFLSKVDGLIAPVFLIIYLASHKLLRRNIRFLALTAGLLLIFPVIISLIYNFDLFALFTMFTKQWKIGTVGYEFSVWVYLLLNSMPSGYVTIFSGYLQLEFWYIFAYIALIYLATKEFEKVADIVLINTTFIALFLIAGGIGSYYLVLLQPFFAIPIGYAVTKLPHMASSLVTFLYLFLYAPVALSIDIFINVGNQTGDLNNLLLVLFKLGTVIFPLLLLICTPILEKKLKKEVRPITNILVLSLLFLFLFLGSYILPVFYPHYLTPFLP